MNNSYNVNFYIKSKYSQMAQFAGSINSHVYKSKNLMIVPAHGLEQNLMNDYLLPNFKPIVSLSYQTRYFLLVKVEWWVQWIQPSVEPVRQQWHSCIFLQKDVLSDCPLRNKKVQKTFIVRLGATLSKNRMVLVLEKYKVLVIMGKYLGNCY